jgi:nicotinate-nucleotide pyrophosphorylase (carboxylating)
MTDQDAINTIVDLALKEDIGSGDITASLIPEDRQATATVICRDHAIICGRTWFDTCFERFDPAVEIDWQIEEPDSVSPDTLLCRLSGPARSLLTVERSALNFLQTLSAVATSTRAYVDALGSSHTRILDTRKTLPGLRTAQKYAVACGGGKNHRVGLYDALLIKENHIMAAGGISAAVQAGRRLHPDKTLEVETEDLTEFQEALTAGADIIMLDNFDLGMITEAVTLNAGRSKLEVSGNVVLENIHEFAESGVDYISIGALTKNIQAIDLSMRIDLVD